MEISQEAKEEHILEGKGNKSDSNTEKSEDKRQDKEKILKTEKEQEELEKIKKKEKIFQDFLKNNFSNELNEENILFIRKLYFNEKKEYLNINELIDLYNNNLEEISKLKNKSLSIKEKINNYDYNIAEEYSIENILKVQKLQFDKNAEIYKGLDVSKYYRFNDSYKKLIDINEIRNIDIIQIKESIRALSDNKLIDIISEDKGKFGNDLSVEDI